jgi:hypothetical protein
MLSLARSAACAARRFFIPAWGGRTMAKGNNSQKNDKKSKKPKKDSKKAEAKSAGK